MAFTVHAAVFKAVRSVNPEVHVAKVSVVDAAFTASTSVWPNDVLSTDETLESTSAASAAASSTTGRNAGPSRRALLFRVEPARFLVASSQTTPGACNARREPTAMKQLRREIVGGWWCGEG